MIATQCQLCEARLNGVLLCHTCTEDVLAMLRAVPWVWAELQTTIHRLDHTGKPSTGGGHGEADGLPISVPAMRHALDLHCFLARTVRTMAAETKMPSEYWPDSRRPAALAGALAGRRDWLRSNLNAGAIASEMGQVIGAAVRCIDLPPEKMAGLFLGACGWKPEPTAPACPKQLWSVPGQVRVTCYSCGTSWDVKGRRLGALEAAREITATAAEISRACTTHCVEVPAATIRSWRLRGELVPAGYDGLSPLYRLGDVLDLLKVLGRRGARRYLTKVL